MRRNAPADRIGGLLMIGFEGTAANDVPADLFAEAAGAILFARNLVNPVQARALLDALRAGSSSGAPLLAIDQEGGPVSRLAAFGTHVPSAMALGAAGDFALTERVYRLIGDELASLGFNLDLAPVADINDEPTNPVIGIRSFGGDSPARVAQHVVAAVRGLQAAGVGATAKHFPGHGSATRDSHEELPVIDGGSDESGAMAPFVSAIAAGVDAVMIAHAAYPKLDASGVAATKSHAVVTGLLRERLGFEGVICSDAMEMKAIAASDGSARPSVAALNAGIDLLLFGESETARVALDDLRRALADGLLDLNRIELSLERIRRMRERLDRAGSLPDLATIASAEHANIVREVARQAVTVIRDPARVLPLALASGHRLFVVNFMDAQKSSARQSTPLGKTLALGPARVTEQIRSLNPAGQEYKQLLMAAGPADAIVAVARDLSKNPLQARAIADLLMLKKTVVAVVAHSPFDAAILPADMTAIATYGDDEAMMAAAAEIILGREQSRGTLPARLPSSTVEPRPL